MRSGGDLVSERDALEEAGADAVGDAIEIDQGEKIDGAELGVDGGRAAEAAGDFEVGAKKARGAWGRGEFASLRAAGGGMRLCAQGGLDEIFFAQGVIEREALVWV